MRRKACSQEHESRAAGKKTQGVIEERDGKGRAKEGGREGEVGGGEGERGIGTVNEGPLRRETGEGGGGGEKREDGE